MAFGSGRSHYNSPHLVGRIALSRHRNCSVTRGRRAIVCSHNQASVYRTPRRRISRYTARSLPGCLAVCPDSRALSGRCSFHGQVSLACQSSFRLLPLERSAGARLICSHQRPPGRRCHAIRTVAAIQRRAPARRSVPTLEPRQHAGCAFHGQHAIRALQSSELALFPLSGSSLAGLAGLAEDIPGAFGYVPYGAARCRPWPSWGSRLIYKLWPRSVS